MSLQTITLDRIRTLLDKHQIKHRNDNDGDVVATWAPDNDCPYRLIAVVRLTGQKKELLSLMVVGERDVPDEQAGEVIVACNEWNRERRWPKAYYTSKDRSLVAEWHWDYEHGVDNETLELQFLESLSGCFAMFKHLAAQGY